MNKELFKSKNTQSNLIKTLKRPVNILVTKVKNIGRRYFRKTTTVNFANHHLDQGIFKYHQLKPFIRTTYCLTGALYQSNPNVKAASCVISFQFYDRKNREIIGDPKLVGLNHSKLQHFHKVIHTKDVYTNFSVFYSAPKKTKKVIIRVQNTDSLPSGLIFIAHAVIERILNSDPSLSLILNAAYERFSLNFNITTSHVREFIEEYSKIFDNDSFYLVQILFHQLKTKIPYAARYFGIEILNKEPRTDFADVMYYIHNRSGSISERLLIVQEMTKKKSSAERFSRN